MVRDSGKPPVRGKTSPYGFFVKMCYEEHKKKYPNENVQVTEISKKCSEKWKTMTDEEKRRFYELAQKDAERYQAEVAAFGGEDALKKRKRAKKDPNAPKRALSAFFFFSQIKRPDVQQGHPEWKVGQVAQELGRQWKDLQEEEKRKYEEMAVRDKGRYEIEMREYKTTGKKPGPRVPMTLPPSIPAAAGAATTSSLPPAGGVPQQLPPPSDELGEDEDEEEDGED